MPILSSNAPHIITPAVSWRLEPTLERITPAIASEMLRGNRDNRKVIRGTVDQLAADMKAGHWRLTHQGIAIAPDGRLLDGQHRLLAIVKAGVAVDMFVWRNADPDGFALMDRGNKRALRDVMSRDTRVLEPCTFLARLTGLGAIQAHHVEPILRACGPAIEALLAEAGRRVKNRTAAPIKAAAALRILQGHREYVTRQWRALVTLEYSDMTPAVQSFCRQTTTGEGPVGGKALQYDRAARAWVAFDPKRQDIRRIQITDITTQTTEMREALNVALEASRGGDAA